MDLLAIDSRIAGLQAQLMNAQTNMDDLGSSRSDYVLAYRLLQNAVLNPSKISGRTRVEALPAFEAMEAIWGHVNLIQIKLDEIARLRGSIPIIGKERRLEEIWAQLNGPCIKLPPVSVPLEQRTLLSPAEVANSVSIENLLKAAVDAFERGKSRIIAIQEAIERLTLVRDNLDRRLTGLAETASRYGVAVAELKAARDSFDRLSRLTMSDPLGAQDQLQQVVEPLIEEAQRHVEAARTSSETLAARLVEARKLLEACHELQTECNEAFDYCRGHLAGIPALPRFPGKLERMSAQLPVVEGNFQRGLVSAATKGWESWSVLAAEFRTSEETARQTYDRLREEHLSLRGMLDALRSRAGRLGLSEDRELTAIVSEADNTMYAPALTDLQAGRQLVERYRDRLRVLETAG